jgi:hypothetical protein
MIESSALKFQQANIKYDEMKIKLQKINQKL